VSFWRVKRPGGGVDLSPPSSAEVEGRVELYLYSLWACYRVNFIFTFEFGIWITTGEVSFRRNINSMSRDQLQSSSVVTGVATVAE
jgi:hypothetical protein